MSRKPCSNQKNCLCKFTFRPNPNCCRVCGRHSCLEYKYNTSIDQVCTTFFVVSTGNEWMNTEDKHVPIITDIIVTIIAVIITATSLCSASYISWQHAMQTCCSCCTIDRWERWTDGCHTTTQTPPHTMRDVWTDLHSSDVASRYHYHGSLLL